MIKRKLRHRRRATAQAPARPREQVRKKRGEAPVQLAQSKKALLPKSTRRRMIAAFKAKRKAKSSTPERVALRRGRSKPVVKSEVKRAVRRIDIREKSVPKKEEPRKEGIPRIRQALAPVARKIKRGIKNRATLSSISKKISKKDRATFHTLSRGSSLRSRLLKNFAKRKKKKKEKK